jgi:hypothetical protein
MLFSLRYYPFANVAFNRVLFKDLDSSDFKQIDPVELHTRLSQLKELLADKLYVKIIIPGKSGLSCNVPGILHAISFPGMTTITRKKVTS